MVWVEVRFREAHTGDAERVAEIYRPCVEDSSISFEDRVPSTLEMGERISRAHLWLMAEADGTGAVGYAYGAAHRARKAYQYSVETSIYVDASSHRAGVGRRLYGELLHRLKTMGFCQALAGTTLPNPASEGLHAAMGFRPIGVFSKVGYKFGRWHDVRWWQLELRPEPPEAGAPLSSGAADSPRASWRGR